jgi:hypothetical protein
VESHALAAFDVATAERGFSRPIFWSVFVAANVRLHRTSRWPPKKVLLSVSCSNRVELHRKSRRLSHIAASV